MGADLMQTVTASNIYVLYPISAQTQAGELVQVDLMPTPMRRRHVLAHVPGLDKSGHSGHR